MYFVQIYCTYLEFMHLIGFNVYKKSVRLHCGWHMALILGQESTGQIDP